MATRLASPTRLRLRGPGRLALTSGAAPAGAGTGTLTLVDVSKDQQVYQRVGTSKIVPISGTLSGAVTQVQARAVPFGTSITSNAYAWTNVATDTAAGTYGGNVNVAQGGPYYWQIRDAVNTGINATGARKWSVGECVGLIGQSNMRLMGSVYNDAPLGDPRSFLYSHSDTFIRLGNVNDSQAPSTPSSGASFSYTTAVSDGSDGPVSGDGLVYLANVLAASLGYPVCLIERAVSGSDIYTNWQAGQDGWNGFAAAVTAAGGDIGSVLWLQGETNAHNLSAASYKTALANVQQQCMTLASRTTANFHFGIITLGVGSFNSSVEGEFGMMRATLADFANTTTGAFLASTAHDSFTSDGVHWVGSPRARVGKRSAKSLAARYGVGASGAGPRITGATRSGNVVTLPVAHSGGTALMDGAGGNGTALTGFEFKDAGAGNAVIAYTTAISGNSFVCTLASTPVGALAVSYAMQNMPHGTSSTTAPVFASIPCDNALYFNSTVGCPLQPLAPITVTGS